MVRVTLQNGDIQLARKTGRRITGRNGAVRWKAETPIGVLLLYESRVRAVTRQLPSSRTLIRLTWWPYKRYSNAQGRRFRRPRREWNWSPYANFSWGRASFGTLASRLGRTEGGSQDVAVEKLDPMPHGAFALVSAHQSPSPNQLCQDLADTPIVHIRPWSS